MSDMAHQPNSLGQTVPEILPPIKEHDGFAHKLTRGVINLPSRTYEKIQYAAIALRHNGDYYLKRGVEAGIIGVEVSPFTNGPIRYGAFAATLATTKDPLLSAAVLGGSTMVMEGSAAVATADLLTTEADSKLITSVNDGLDKADKLSWLVPPKGEKLHPLREALLALYLGSSCLILSKHREDSTKSKQQLAKHGLATSAGVSAYLTAQGVALSEGMTDITNPRVVVPVAVTLAGLQYAVRKAKNKIKKNTPDNA